MTAAEAMKANFEEKRRVEKINGVTVMLSAMPAVNHNRVVTNLVNIFSRYLRGKRCEAFFDGVQVHLDEENTFVPDAMIVCNKDIIKHNGIYGAPDLVVEVLSPSTGKNDRGPKKDVYERHGVREYWIADTKSKSIEVYLLRDGHFVLDNIYNVYEDWEWEQLSEEEKATAKLPLKVSLYDDFFVDVREVFERV